MAWPSSSVRTKNWGTEVLTDTDLEAQFDLLHTYHNDSLSGTTGHGHTGGTADGIKIVLTTAVSGTLPLANGGTGQTTLAGLLGLIYPVGSIYMNATVATNPGTLLGFGTWTAYGAGKVVFGLDAGGDTSFDALTDTGGAKTVTLTTTELPAHTHSISMQGTSVDGATTVPTGGNTGTARTGATASAGSGSAFSILPPYVVCYFWKRTV